MALMFKFISGKYKGGEFPLDKNLIVIGRHSDLEMVLSEDMVSRKHAKMAISGNEIILEDMGSTNGTFVNGSRIKKVKLKLNDRILIGTSIAKLVDSSDIGQNMEDAAKVGTNAVSGSIEDIPIPEVLQLLATSKKTGVLKVTSGSLSAKLQLVQGVFKDVFMGDSDIAPQKILMKLIKLNSGFFEFNQEDPSNFGNRLNITLDAFLLEAAKYEDEVGLDDLDFEIDDDLILDDFDEVSISELSVDEDDVFDLDDFNGDIKPEEDDDIFNLDDDFDDEPSVNNKSDENDNFNLDDDFDLSDLDDDKEEVVSDSKPKDDDFNLDDDLNDEEIINNSQNEESRIDLIKLKDKFPEDSEFVLPLPIFSPLCELNKEELKILQLVYNFSSISDILENTELSEENTYSILDKLLEEDYIEQ